MEFRSLHSAIGLLLEYVHFSLSHPEDWPSWTVFLNRSLEYEFLVAILKIDWLILFIKIKTLPKKGLKSFKLTGFSQMCKKRQEFLR